MSLLAAEGEVIGFFGLLNWSQITGLSKFWVDLLSIPIFSAIAGLLTNWTGVIMLFAPTRFSGFYMPGAKQVYRWMPRIIQILPIWAPGGILGFQGFVPARAEKMGSLVVDKAIAKIGNVKDFMHELDPDGIAAYVAEVARPQIRSMVDEVMEKEHPQLWADMPMSAREVIYQRVEQELPGISQRAFRTIGDNIDQLLDLKLLAVGYVRRHPEDLEVIFRGMGAPELRFMVKSGLLGAPMGLILAIYLHFHHNIPIISLIPVWLVILTAAALIGIIVNIIAIRVVFTPGTPQPRYKYLWKQAKLAKRQHQAAGDFGHLLAYRILTMPNIARDILNGPRGDKTRGILQEFISDEVNTILGRMTSMVRVAVGAREFEAIRTSAGSAALTFAPTLIEDADFTRAQAEKIEEFATEKLRELPPDQFMDMLYSAIEQDAWLLYAHGGLLGILVGAAHLLFFGW